MIAKYHVSVSGPPLLILLIALLLCTACVGQRSHLIYRAGGSAAEATIIYSDSDGSERQEIGLPPWQTTIEIDGESRFRLVVVNNQPAGEVECAVRIDDSDLVSRQSRGFAVCGGSVHLEGESVSSSQFSYSAESELGEVIRLMEGGELERALAKAEKTLEMAPAYAEAHFVLALVYNNMDDREQALAAYDHVIALDPESERAFHNRGLLCLDMAELEQAIADFSAAIEIEPEGVNSYYARAIAHSRQGDLELSRKDLLKVRELADDPEMQDWAERALAKLGERN